MRFSRRRALALLGSPLVSGQQARKSARSVLPPNAEIYRYTDPTTENVVTRLTDPRHTSLLPAPQNHFISSRSRSLIYSSDRTGKLALFHMDLRTASSRQLFSPVALDARSVSMDAKEQFVYFRDGGDLRELTLATLKQRTVDSGISAFALGVERQLVVLRNGALELLTADSPQRLADGVESCGQIRPDGKGCWFMRRAGPNPELWYVDFANSSGAKKLADGPLRFCFWAPDSSAVLYLRDVNAVSEVHEIPVGGSEQVVSRTSQFASFSPNGNASVFVGASRSLAQPNIMLLIRSVRRELTLCEHRASNAANVTPVFSPSSHNVFFQSDHYGKSAIFAIGVEALVEPT